MADAQAGRAPLTAAETAAVGCVRGLLDNLVPGRLGDPQLEHTPERYVRALGEMLRGYDLDPVDVIRVTGGASGFHIEVDQMIVVGAIPFWSLCEHHLLPFGGFADVGYLPADGLVCGASKLPRLVEMYASRLQVQERMAKQIADALESTLKPRGVGVRLRAVHLCIRCRGVRAGGTMLNEDLRGRFRAHEVRGEFASLANEAYRSVPMGAR